MLKTVVALCLVGIAVCGPPVSRPREEIQKFRDFLEASRTEAGVTIPSNLEGTEPNTWMNSGKYQGDMLLDDEQIESMVQQFSAGRNAYIAEYTQWPGASIPYVFAQGQFDDIQMGYIRLIMGLIEDHTCIRFRPRRRTDLNFVRITGRSDGCYASVGYWPYRGIHTLNVARDVPGYGCLNGVVIVHEWLHVIGFFHMQSTYNRDDYVRINWQNILAGMEHNFDKYGPELVSNLGLPYEYESCMHYGTHGFSINGRPTLEALRPHTGELGQTDYVTGWDFWRVDRLYGCTDWRSAKEYPSIRFNGTTPHTGELGQTDYVTGWDFWRVDRLYGCTDWRSAKEYPSIRFNGTTVDIISNN